MSHNPKNLPTNDLEKHIGDRYEQGAEQTELNDLETIYAERVSEETPGFLDEREDDQTGEDGEVGLEENIATVYGQYLHGTYNWEYEDLIGNMRASVDEYGGLPKKISDEELFNIAKKLYEDREALIGRYKNQPMNHDKFKTFLSGLRTPKNASLHEAIEQGYQAIQEANMITLYRGMENEYNSKHDLSKTDAPHGYSTWTDNPNLAKKYAGQNGFIYKITLPISQMGNEYMDADGERTLFFNNEKKAGLDNISGNEYLIYHHHDLFNEDSISITDY
jgi:hypothetical protein